MTQAITSTRTQTTNEILGTGPARKLLEDIFADLHPALIDERHDIASIFTPQTAGDFLAQLVNFEKLLSDQDSYEVTVKKLQTQIDQAEQVRDQLLSDVFHLIRPIQPSHREPMLFFE